MVKTITSYNSFIERQRHAARHSRPGSTGSKNVAAKLTESIVRHIRRKFAKGKLSIRAAARKYGIDFRTAYSAIHRHTWRHVE
jgi:helix-turn-helix, Psq domain